MQLYKYNDYYLIYLVQSEQCEAALNILIKKYENMAYKYINLYNVKETDYEDYMQEAAILLYRAINLFIDKYNKTFTRYYELILKRRILYLKKLEPKYELNEAPFVYKDNNPFNDYKFEKIEGLATFEQEIFERYFVLNQKIAFIAKELNKTSKQIYNAIYRIKSKYKNNML